MSTTKREQTARFRLDQQAIENHCIDSEALARSLQSLLAQDSHLPNRIRWDYGALNKLEESAISLNIYKVFSETTSNPFD